MLRCRHFPEDEVDEERAAAQASSISSAMQRKKKYSLDADATWVDEAAIAETLVAASHEQRLAIKDKFEELTGEPLDAKLESLKDEGEISSDFALCCNMVMKTPLQLLPELIRQELDSETSLLARVGDGLIAGINAVAGASLVARVQTTVLTRTLAGSSKSFVEEVEQAYEDMHGERLVDRIQARARPFAFALSPDFVPGLPHVMMIVELRQALSSYQDYRMLLLAPAGQRRLQQGLQGGRHHLARGRRGRDEGPRWRRGQARTCANRHPAGGVGGRGTAA